MTPTEKFQIVLSYFPELTAKQQEQFLAMYAIYEEWNGKINVISRKDTENFYERHVLHSLAIARLVRFKAGSKVLDVGTGGGFPGVPLAVMFPDVRFHLVDSIAKKIKVVADVAEKLGLQNLTCEQCRMEELNGKYDFVVNRAVAEMDTLIHWTAHLIEKKSQNPIPNGWLSLKGGDLVEEFTNIRRFTEFFELNVWFKEEFFLTKKLVYVKFS